MLIALTDEKIHSPPPFFPYALHTPPTVCATSQAVLEKFFELDGQLAVDAPRASA